MKQSFFYLIAAILVTCASSAQAQNVPSAAIIDALIPEKTGPVVRSMTSSAKRGIKISGELPPEVDLPRINLTINFELDSAILTNEGMVALRSLAKALHDPRLSGMQFQVAGHTDGRGDNVYNVQLSERRATTVVEHLVNFYDVDPTRLSAIGYGMKNPVDPANVMNPLNRRVEIINLAPLS